MTNSRTFTGSAWAPLVVATALVSALGLVTCLSTAGCAIFSEQTSGVVAAWVQAVGSVGALAGVWFTIRHQVNHQNCVKERESSERDLNAARACLSIALDVERMMRGIQKKLEDLRQSIGTERIEETLISLRALEARDLSADVMECTLELKREVAYTLTAIHRHNRADDVPAHRVEAAGKRLQKVTAAIEKLNRIRSACELRNRKATEACA